MENFLKLIRLSKKRKSNMRYNELVNIFEDHELLELTEELNVLGVFERDGTFEIQLAKLEDLHILGYNPSKRVTEATIENNKFWVHYEVEINGIIFKVVKKELKEEHKKTQAI